MIVEDGHTCVSALVYFEILAAGEHLAASRERAGERLLAGVDADVVHQLVLRLERTAVPRAVLPEAGVRGALGPADVLHRQVRHDLVHAREVLAAALPGRRLLRVHPQALHLLLDRLPHIAKKRAVHVARMVRHRHRRMVQILVVVVRLVGRVVVLRARVQHLVVHRVLVRTHLRVVVEEHGLAGRRLRGREVVVVPPQQEVPRRVPRVRI